MADVYQNGTLYNVGKAIKNGIEYPFDWTMLNEYNQLVSYYDNVKGELRTSIINKGVDVPASASIDTYPGYIDQIDTGGIYGNLDSSPIRVNLFKESSSDNVGNISGKPLSYIYGDYLFIIAPYGTYSGNYQQANVRCGAWKKGTEDYKASKATVSSSSDKGFDMVGAKINISGTTASIEICLRKFITNESFYFYKLTNSFNMSSLTWGSWATVSEGPTATNPYFSEYVNDQNLVSGDVEQIDGAGIIRLIPGGSQTGKNLSLYTTSVYAGTSQGESANIYRASMSGKYAFTATYNGYGTPSHGHSVKVSADGGTSFEDMKYTSTAKTVTGYFYAPSGSYIVATATGYSYSSCAVENIKLQYMGFEDR